MTDTRKSKPWKKIFAVIIALVLMYLPSYALYLRWIGNASQNVHVPFYAPVEWLIDSSHAKQPLLWWADVCGVKEQTELAAVIRELQQQLEKITNENDKLQRDLQSIW